MRDFGLLEDPGPAETDVYTPEETGAPTGDLVNPDQYEDTLGMGEAIASELVKSYGFDRDPDTGDWSWSLGNIKRAYQEDPMWTALDHILVVAPPARWAVGLRRVAKGAEMIAEGADETKAGIAAKTLAAARRGDENAMRILDEKSQSVGRFGQTVGHTLGYGDEDLGAVSIYFSGPGQLERLITGTDPHSMGGRFARAINPVSPVTQNIDADYLDLIREYGGDPAEMRAVGRMFARDKMALLGYYERTAEEIIRQTGRNITDDDARVAISYAMDNGLDSDGLAQMIRAKAQGVGDDGLHAVYGDVVPGDQVERFIRDAQKDIGMRISRDDAVRLLDTDSGDLMSLPGQRREYAAAWRDRRLLEEAAIVSGVDKLNPAALRAYQKTIDFRDEIHDTSYALGLISEETYTRQLQRYRPRRYEEFETLRAGMRASGAKGAGSSDAAGRGAFQARTVGQQDLTAAEELYGGIFSPELTADGLAKIGFAVAEQQFAQRLANSVVAKTGDELWREVGELIASGDGRAMALNGITDEVLQVIGRHQDNMSEEALDDIARAMGWGKVEDLYRGKQSLPAYMDNLPDELVGKYIDPNVIEDIPALFADGRHPFWQAYRASLGFFRAGKTAYNPATHFRNLIGAMIFHQLAVGGVGAWGPKGLNKGITAWFAREGEDFTEALRAGMIGSTFDHETQEFLRGALGSENIGRRVTAVDFLGSSAVAKRIQKTAGQAERVYRAEDEIFKLDAFIRNRDRFLARGMSRDDAIRASAREVNKYMPTYIQNSPLTNQLRQFVPFSSFTTEAVRIWKNAIVEKPHLVFFWNHMAETMSQVGALTAGFSPEEVESARSAMPWYMQGKKALLWPARVSGKPVFLDMSYLIPMANLPEAADAEASFFQRTLIDPTANPFGNLVVAGSTGRDAFSGRKIEPNFTERQLGVTVDSPGARQYIGMAEHIARVLLPPLIPPGYAGTNLIEYARGQKDPNTGADLEQGFLRTVGANVFGLRLYEADVQSQIRNVKRDTRLRQEKIGREWQRWKWGHANGRVDQMEAATKNIRTMRIESGDTPERADKYLKRGASNREAGKLRTVSTKHLQEALDRSIELGYKDEDDLRAISEMRARITERTGR